MSPPAAQIEISLLETENRSDAEMRAERPPLPSVPAPRDVRHHPLIGEPMAPRAATPSDRAAASNDSMVSRGPAPPDGPGTPTPPAPSPERMAPGIDHNPDLSFDGLRESAKQRIAAIPNRQEDLERLLVPAPEVTGRRRTLSEARASAERQADAVENVRLGRAHPLHFDYLRHARDLIAAEADRLGDQLHLDVQETLEGWARGYLDRLREISAGRDAPMSHDVVGGQRPDVLGAFNEAEVQAASGAARRVAHVCLGVAPNHSVVVTLRRSSGVARLDEIAMASFQSATTSRPVASDVRPGLACYLVGVSAYRMPPLRSLSLGWKNGRPELIHPLKRINRVIVELESVDYGPQPGPSSLLRRPH